MRTQTMTMIAMALLVGCKGGDKAKPADKTPADKAQAHATNEPERVTSHELATAPLQNVESTAGGVPFTIDLPVALLKPPQVKDAYSTWEPKKAWMDTPDISVVFSEFPMQPDATGDAEPLGDDAKDRKIVRAEKLPEGGYLNLDARNDHAFFSLSVCRPAKAGSLCCTVIQRAQKPIEGYDEVLGLAEKVCKSVKVKG